MRFGLNSDRLGLLASGPARRIKLAAIRTVTFVFCIGRVYRMAALAAYTPTVDMSDHGVKLQACYAIRASHGPFHARTLLLNSEDYPQARISY